MDTTGMKKIEEKKVVTLPRAIAEQALSGGFSSLWLPVEIGFISNDTDTSVSMVSGSRHMLVGICVQGQGWFEYAGIRHSVKQGQVWVAMPGIPYSYGSEGDRPWSYYWFHLAGERIAWFRNLLLKEGNAPIFPVTDIMPLASLLHKTINILEKGFYKRNLDCASLIFGHLMAELSLSRHTDTFKIVPVDQRLEKTIDWLKEHVEGTIDARELAAMCNLSLSYFTACFHDHTGYRVHDYFIRLKMEKACELLKNTELPVKAIAATLGYNDQLYFSRSFKKVYAYPPLAWRKGIST